MLFQKINVIDETFTERKGLWLGTEGDRITYLSDRAPERPERFGEVYADCEGKLLIPSFCSAHTHMPMALLRGYGENEPLMSWLTKKVFPFEAKLRAEDVYYATLLAAAEAFRLGMVCASEMYFFGESMAKAVLESGMKSNCCLSVSAFGEEHYRELPIFRENEALLRDYDGAGEGRFRVDFCLHSEYTTTERVVREVAEAAGAAGKRIQLHLSETAGETEACRERHGGLSPAEYMNACGVFENPVTAAHCVHVSERDVEILKEKNVSVASCPKSNLKLASGIAPVTRMLRAGLNVAVGTDGVASNNNLNMLEEMKIFNFLQKYKEEDASVISPAQSLYAATRAGFLSQGREDSGLIREGFKADLAVIDLDQPYVSPCGDGLNGLVYSACGTDVCLSMCDGRVVYRDGSYPTIDIEKVKAEVRASRARILGELGEHE